MVFFFFLIIRRPPRSTRPDTLFPYTTLFRSLGILAAADPRIAHDDGRAAGNDGGFHLPRIGPAPAVEIDFDAARRHHRSEEHTSELQSLMRISYAVFCLKKKKKDTHKLILIETCRIMHKTIEIKVIRHK